MGGLNYRRVGRQLGVNHVTVMNWVRDQALHTPELAVAPTTNSALEVDELFAAVAPKADKKTPCT